MQVGKKTISSWSTVHSIDKLQALMSSQSISISSLTRLRFLFTGAKWWGQIKLRLLDIGVSVVAFLLYFYFYCSFFVNDTVTRATWSIATTSSICLWSINRRFIKHWPGALLHRCSRLKPKLWRDRKCFLHQDSSRWSGDSGCGKIHGLYKYNWP